MTTFRSFFESFGYEAAMDVYYRLGGDGKKSIAHPDFPGFYIHPNGIVSPDVPISKEHQPLFDPLKVNSFGTYSDDVW